MPLTMTGAESVSKTTNQASITANFQFAMVNGPNAGVRHVRELWLAYPNHEDLPISAAAPDFAGGELKCPRPNIWALPALARVPEPVHPGLMLTALILAEIPQPRFSSGMLQTTSPPDRPPRKPA
jgi:hypothetical protein